MQISKFVVHQLAHSAEEYEYCAHHFIHSFYTTHTHAHTIILLAFDSSVLYDFQQWYDYCWLLHFFTHSIITMFT